MGKKAWDFSTLFFYICIKKNKMKDSGLLTIGTAQLYYPAFKGMSKEKFIQTYRGRISIDLDTCWELIQSAIRKESKAAEPATENIKSKKSKAK